MTTQAPPTSLLPLSPEQLARLQAAVVNSPNPNGMVVGLLLGMVNQQPGAVASPAVAAPPPVTVTLISASQTGNARRLAEQLRDDLLAAQLSVNLVNAGDYKFKQIAQERLLVVVASTQGEGSQQKKPSHCINSCFLKSPKIIGDRICCLWLR